MEPCEGRNNNDENMRYVNVDGAPRFDSSRATLTLPDGARVVRAYLYWGADLARGVSDSNTVAFGAPGGETPVDPANPAAGGTNTLWTTALMRVGGGGYTTVDATAPGRQGSGRGSAVGIRASATSPASPIRCAPTSPRRSPTP